MRLQRDIEMQNSATLGVVGAAANCLGFIAAKPDEPRERAGGVITRAGRPPPSGRAMGLGSGAAATPAGRPIDRLQGVRRLTYTVEEVASMLGLGRTTIFRLLKDHDLRRVKVGARTLILAEDVDALLQRQNG